MTVTERLKQAAENERGIKLSASEVLELRPIVTKGVEVIVGLKPYVPMLDARAPWLAQDNTIDAGLLFSYCAAPVGFPGHAEALDQVRDVKARWEVATGPDANGDPKDPTTYFALYAGQTSLDDIKRIVAA